MCILLECVCDFSQFFANMFLVTDISQFVIVNMRFSNSTLSIVISDFDLSMENLLYGMHVVSYWTCVVLSSTHMLYSCMASLYLDTRMVWVWFQEMDCMVLNSLGWFKYAFYSHDALGCSQAKHLPCVCWLCPLWLCMSCTASAGLRACMSVGLLVLCKSGFAFAHCRQWNWNLVSQVPSLRLQQRRMRVLVSMLRCTMPIEHTRTWFGRQRNRSLELFPKPGPKVGLDLETALAKSIPNSAALGMKLQNSKCISMPKIVVFGNEFRFCKIQICAQNLGVELVLVFLQFCKFLVGKFLFESFEFESFELEVHGKVYFGSSWKFIQVFESLCGKVLGSKSAILFIDFFCSWGFWVYQNPRINEYLIATLIIKFQYILKMGPGM